jgi:integrase
MSAEGKKWSQSYATSKVPYYLREIFGLARTLKFMSVDNPAVNLEAMPVLSKGEQKSRQKPRFPLTTAHINKLLASDWYNPSSKKWRGKLGQDLGVRYFVPLIELLHGSRIREPLQLMVSEVAMIHGVWSFKFRMSFDGDEDEASTGFKKKNGGNADSAPAKVVNDLAPRSLKNESVLRDIPVHPKLLELGLLDYLELRRHQLDGKDGPLFPSSPPEPGGKSPKWGRAFEQALLRFMKDGLDFADGYVIHSFRHTFEDRLRDSQAKQTWPPGMNQFLSGRKLVRAEDKGTVPESGSEAEYGKGYSPAAALPYLERIDFSDIVFPRPFGEWLSAGLR